jgi:hypothetical protein
VKHIKPITVELLRALRSGHHVPSRECCVVVQCGTRERRVEARPSVLVSSSCASLATDGEVETYRSYAHAFARRDQSKSTSSFHGETYRVPKFFSGVASVAAPMR